MTPRRIYQAVGDAQRFRFIVTELWKAGLDFAIDRAALRYVLPITLRYRPVSATRRAHFEKNFPIRLRELFERLGPTFVKLGQMLSVRSDLVGSAVAAELAKLQRNARPFVLRDEKFKRQFKSFEEKPFAAASLAQVHRARLEDGTRVAVKIQRPGIRPQIENDLHIMAILARVLEDHVADLRPLRPTRIVREFADWTMRELDFEVEGSNLDRFRHNFAENPRVRVPRVFWQYTAREVLVMELIEGKPLEKVRPTDRRVLAEIGIGAAFQQFFVDGFFQADPHPGNFVALQGSTLVFHDLGQVGYLTRTTRSELVACLMAYLARDTENYTKHLLDLAEIGPESDIPAFKRGVQNVLDRVMFKPTAKKRVSAAFAEVLSLAVNNGIYFPTDLILFSKALLTIESVGRALAPNFDLDAALGPALDTAIRSEFSPRRIARDIQTEAFDLVNFTRALPGRLSDLLKKVETGNLGVKLDFDELKDLKREFDRQNDERVLALIVVALFIGSAAILSSPVVTATGLLLGRIGLGLTAALFLWLIKQVAYKPS